MSSEDAKTFQKRALLNQQDMDTMSGLVYPNSPIPRSPRKPTVLHPTHFPSSSGQATSVLRHKSPASRHLSPHRSPSRNKICYNWEDSIRKTQSTALPALKGELWPRGTTASTPDLKVEDQSVGTEANHPGSYIQRRNSQTTCYYNLSLVLVILNCIILGAGLTYLTTGVLMIIYEENVLIIIEYWLYVLCLILLYTEAVVLLFLSVIELGCVRHDGSRKLVSCFFLIATLTIILGIMQNTLHNNVQKNLKQQMISSIRLEPDATTSAAWDYFQETFKCCGARGYLDWCEKNDVPDNATNSTDFLGSYTCQLPISCCNDDIDKTMYSGISWNSRKSAIQCSISPTPWNTHHVGCLAYLRREIYYIWKLFRIISFGTGIILFLSSAIATIIFVYF